MKKALLPILAVSTLSACMTTIPETETYHIGKYEVPKSYIEGQNEYKKKRKIADGCDSLSTNPKNIDIQKAKDLISNQPWKDPFSLKITEIKGADPKTICYFENNIPHFLGYSLSTFYGMKTPYAIGTVYAKNGYGAYGGATRAVVFTDGTVETDD